MAATFVEKVTSYLTGTVSLRGRAGRGGAWCAYHVHCVEETTDYMKRKALRVPVNPSATSIVQHQWLE